MCFNSQSTKLKITTLEQVYQFRERVRDKSLNQAAYLENLLATKTKNSPWTTITLIHGFPTYADLDAEDHIGSARFKLIGKVPADLAIYISENHTNVTEQNATWTCKNPFSSYTIYPRDQCIHNAKKASD